MTTKTKPRPKAGTRDLISEATTWPDQRQLADDYNVSQRWVRALVDRGLVETVRLNTIRINPASFETYIESTHNRP